MPTGTVETTSYQLQDPQTGPMSIVSTNQPRTQLRRASYIHVSDLTSAYNIDHVRLEEELDRVKTELATPVNDDSSTSFGAFGGVPTELDTSYKKRLQPPRGGNNMVALVGKVRIVVDKNRVDGSRVRLAEVEIGDETGTVSLRARDEQIEMLQLIADRSGAVVLRNCTVELYQGKHIRLAVTKWGKMSAYPDQVPSTPPPPSKINRDRNFSMINLSLVASEMSSPKQQHVDHPQFRDIDVTSLTGSAGQTRGSFQSMSRRGRRPARGKMSSSPNMPAHYPDSGQHNSSIRPYRGSNLQHGYTTGFVADNIGVPQYYVQRQPESAIQSSQQQQQLMLQHQFEMQQHQMQIYHGGPAQDSPQRPLQPSSPMLIPGAASFDTTYSTGSDSHISQSPMPGSHMFMMPIPTAALPNEEHQSQETNVLQSSRSLSPQSIGKMNPQAATFDPSSGKVHGHPSS